MREKETLNELIQLFHEERVVEKLIETQQEAGLGKVKIVYAEQKRKFSEKINQLHQKVYKSIKHRKAFINDDYNVYPEDVLQVCIICMMSNISEMDLLKDWYQVIKALKKVDDKYKPLAEKIIKLIDIAYDCEGDNFTSYTTEELLEKFFND